MAPNTGNTRGEEWEPLQCDGCGRWFPVLKRAIEAIESVEGNGLKMRCQVFAMTLAENLRRYWREHLSPRKASRGSRATC